MNSHLNIPKNILNIKFLIIKAKYNDRTPLHEGSTQDWQVLFSGTYTCFVK